MVIFAAPSTQDAIAAQQYAECKQQAHKEPSLHKNMQIA
jgi:hypothetical protein